MTLKERSILRARYTMSIYFKAVADVHLQRGKIACLGNNALGGAATAVTLIIDGELFLGNGSSDDSDWFVGE